MVLLIIMLELLACSAFIGTENIHFAHKMSSIVGHITCYVNWNFLLSPIAAAKCGDNSSRKRRKIKFQFLFKLLHDGNLFGWIWRFFPRYVSAVPNLLKILVNRNLNWNVVKDGSFENCVTQFLRLTSCRTLKDTSDLKDYRLQICNFFGVQKAFFEPV